MERERVRRFVLDPCQGYDRICQASLEEDDAGDFVYYTDYAAMEARALQAEDRIRRAVEAMGPYLPWSTASWHEKWDVEARRFHFGINEAHAILTGDEVKP